MLESDKFVPHPRDNFRTAFQNLHVGQSITLPNLGQAPKHFAKGYQGKTLLVTKQMIDIWDELSADSGCSIKRILSGPMGVDKSYISYFFASKAYAEEWIILYIADASDLIVETSDEAGETICQYFFALNKDKLTSTDLVKITQLTGYPSKHRVEVVVAGAIFKFLKESSCKTLLVVDEHGILFEKDPPVPERLQILSPLMNLNYWGDHYKFACVIFTGTAHAKYEREHIKNGSKQDYMVFVGPLQSDVFDKLLQLHPVLRIPDIKEEAKMVMNCVPREVMHLVKYIDSLEITITNAICFRQALKKFEDDWVDDILLLAQQYYNVISKNEKNRYYQSLTSMFLPSRPIVQFDWKFLDLGLIYRYKEVEIIHYLPLCPSAQKALLKMYTSFDLPENVRDQLRAGELNGTQFEEVLFNRLVSRCGTTIQLSSTDLNNRNRKVITLKFDDYSLIKSSQLSLGPGNDKVLGCGFNRYPRFDFVLERIFIQVSISDFVTHNSKKSKNIKRAFESPMPQLSNHPMKVNEFPDVAHVSFEEIRTHLFSNIA